MIAIATGMQAAGATGYAATVADMDEQEFRRQRLAAAVRKYGSKAKLGKALGYKSGAFVRQMLDEERPITEKTVEAIEELPGMARWFAKDSSSPHQAIDQAIAVLDAAISAADPAIKEALAINMAGWAKDGGGPWAGLVRALLGSNGKQHPRAA